MANGLHSGRHRLCLLCLTNPDELYPIFGDDNLADKIYDCIAVKIDNVDCVPALICQQCRSKVFIHHHFVIGCQTADRKFHRLYEPQFRQHWRLVQNGEQVRTAGEELVLPSKIPAKRVANVEAVPAKHAVLQRLKSDDKPLRRHSVDPVRKVNAKPETKRRLSVESHLSSVSIKQMAAKIEQALSHDPDRKKCPKCGHMVKNLSKHLELHSTIRKQTCEICSKIFNKRSSLQYHMNLHTGAKPYKCRECGKGFNCPTKVWTHRQNNSECASSFRRRKCHRYHCNACRDVFKHRVLLDQHMSTQHPERKHPCEACGKTYLTGSHLYRHRISVHRPDKKET